MLKFAFNIPKDDQGSHADDISDSVLEKGHPGSAFCLLSKFMWDWSRPVIEDVTGITWTSKF